MDKLILAVSPDRTAAAGRYGLPLAHLAYRVGSGPHLYRANSPAAPQGGFMVIDNVGFDGGGEAEPFCSEVLRECAARRFSGVLCRFKGRPDPTLSKCCARLEEGCRSRGLKLWVTEQYAACGAGVLISTALSGGSLRGRLEAAAERWGAGRVAVWTQRTAEDFPLPSPSGSGRGLTAEELDRLRTEKGGSVFFSPELCAHYFTYMAGDTGHFVLFDDVASVRKKLSLVRETGVGAVFLPYGELAQWLGELLG